MTPLETGSLFIYREHDMHMCLSLSVSVLHSQFVCLYLLAYNKVVPRGMSCGVSEKRVKLRGALGGGDGNSICTIPRIKSNGTGASLDENDYYYS